MRFEVVVFLVNVLTFVSTSSDLWIIRLSVDGDNDVVDNSNPRLGWYLEATSSKQNISQKAYQILVATTLDILYSEKPDLWNTGKVQSDQTWNIKYEGKSPKPGQTVFWAVKIWDQDDGETDYCQGSWRQEFVMSQWTAKWISAPKGLKEKAFSDIEEEDKKILKSHPGLKPVLYFRKTFSVEGNVENALIYCTAKGIFTGYLTDDYGMHNERLPLLEPGWTNYNQTILYHTFDVTSTVKSYRNHTLGFTVAPGWCTGYIGPENNHSIYGNETSLLFELHMTFSNGSKRIINSDDTWRVNNGPLLYSDLLHGEVFYENRQLGDWTTYDYEDSNWYQVVTTPLDKNVKLVSDSIAPEISALKTRIKSIDCKEVSKNTYVYKFKKLITGKINFIVADFPDNGRITVRYAETVYPNGSIFTGNHKSALDTDVFLLNDPANRQNGITLSTSFPYHSFQYAEVSGFPNPLNTSVAIYGFDFTQEHISSQFLTDNKILNQLYGNIARSQAANFLSVPTNSPSKDARLGWLEPAGLSSLSMMYSSGKPGPFKKWLRDIRESQASSGVFSNVAPRAVDDKDASPVSGTSPIIITYNLYRMFGDIRAVEENYESNGRWLKYVRGSNPDFLFTRNTGENGGDIGNVNSESPKEVIATSYYAYSALLMSYMSKALNKTTEHDFYVRLHSNVSRAFVKAYVNETDGKIKGNTQTGYVVALAFKVVPEKLIPLVVKNLVDNVIGHEYHLTTGYVGTAHLLSVLVDHGHPDIAYKVLLQDTFPSWIYMIINGATNIWERWDSWTENKPISNSSLNSLALGSVGSFLFQYIAGIDTDDVEVGFKKIIIKPHIGAGVGQVTGRFFSNYGLISSSWILNNSTFEIEVEIPPNSKGKLLLPFKKEKWEKELSSGIHKFKVPLD